jgi:hypothetical protein
MPGRIDMVVDELIESLYREVSVMDHEESFFLH